ncbi:hypothetical protein Pfo_018035 [Paulownia fortunei]|nr:hypothetical protein Pfo_018035 [Paulownia fortunei]
MAESTVSLKLLIDTQGKRVLFAEASKDCVDFLFHILSLPVATLISLMGKQGMVGSLANLYESIENLNESYMQPNQTKDTLLKPKFYRCTQGGNYVSFDPCTICPHCNRYMNTIMQYAAPPPRKQASDEGGFVKGVVTYMVMDDLVAMPMSTISSITLLNKFNVKEVGALEEKVAVKLLKASLETKKVLTHVFMKGVK